MLNCAWCGATDQSVCKNQKNCHTDKQSSGWGCMNDIDILTTCGTLINKTFQILGDEQYE